MLAKRARRRPRADRLEPRFRAPCPTGRPLDPEIVQLFAGLKLGGQPARLLAAARPSLYRLGGISMHKEAT